MKTCTRCGFEKDRSDFYKRTKSPDGLQPLCKKCNDEKTKQYYADHPGIGAVISARRRVNHPEETITTQRGYRARNPGRGAAYTKRHEEKNASDPNFRLKKRLRTRLNHAIRDKKAGSAVSDMGCVVGVLKAHLESLFLGGMTWDNWGAGIGKWNIDHIMPLSAFDLTDRQHFLLANHYLNLQPLWAVENIVKGNKIPSYGWFP